MNRIAVMQIHDTPSANQKQHNATTAQQSINSTVDTASNIISQPTVKSKTTRTTCPYCGVGCGVLAHVVTRKSGEQISITGDEQHPANSGQLCIKGHHLADTLTLQGRVLYPMLGRQPAQPASVQRIQTDWTHAIDLIAQKFQQLIASGQADRIAFYVSGQLLTEDYYVVNKFVKGYLGTANIDTNSRLCMSSAVAAHQRAFGEDLVPASYADFEQTEMVVLVGSNTAWCHPVLYQRIIRAKAQRNVYVVVIDPRFTPTCEMADLHLPILAGQDVALFNGLLQYLWQGDYADTDFIRQHTQDLAALLQCTQAQADIADVSEKTAISQSKLNLFFAKFAQTAKVMTLFSMGVNQSSRGTDKANSIINCHLLTGKIGRVGAAPFSITGQPNAMGGREVGGLANMLAAHLSLDNPQHQQLLQTFWQSPRIATQPGLKAVDLFEAVEQGRIKAIWIMATNPVVSLPNANQVKRALEKCEFVVISDLCLDTDTTQYADVLLPALAWGEKEGSVTNSERCISRQRAFLAAPAQAKADWWAVCKVAQKLGFTGFDFKNSYDIFQEHARLSAYQNVASSPSGHANNFRYFNLQALTALTASQYDALAPIQWPVLTSKPHAMNAAVLFAQGQFAHANGKARFIATPALDPKHPRTYDYPLILNTGRIRDQWHSMTRTGLSAHLTLHITEPYVEIHADDALQYGIQSGALVTIQSAWGRCVLRAYLSDKIRRGHVFAPIHWSDQFASDARIGQVVNPVVDAISGEPEFKHTPVRIQPFYTQWQGVLFVREAWAQQVKQSIEQTLWWTKIRMPDVTRYELADRRAWPASIAHFQQCLSFQAENLQWLRLEDHTAQMYRCVVLCDDQLIACLYIGLHQDVVDRDWLADLFQRDRLGAKHRKALLAGRALSHAASEGALVCSCFKVGKNRIITAILENKLRHEQQVSTLLKAGSNCGSCLAEIRALIKANQVEP